MLKNSGVKFSIVFALGNIQHGYGDEVCYILNDVSTDILVRRNYEFSLPLVKEGEIGGRQRSDAQYDDYDVEDWHGGHGDIGHDDDSGNIVDMALVDENAWREECGRVQEDLQALEVELNQGYTDKVEMYQANLINGFRLSKDIHKFANLLQDSQLSYQMEKVQDELSYIYEREKSLTTMNADYLEEVKHFCENNKEYDEEILRLTLGNKRKIEEYSNMKATYQSLNEAIKQRQSMHTDNSRLLKMKDSIFKLTVALDFI